MTERRILIAEDESSLRDLYQRVLGEITDLGIDFAVDGEELVSKVRTNPDYNLVITDFHMPRMDGLEATRRIKETGYIGSVVVVTSDHLTQDQLKEMGFDNYLQKPLNIVDLANKVRSYLR